MTSEPSIDVSDVSEGSELLARLARLHPERYAQVIAVIRDVVDTEAVLDTAPLVLRAKAAIRRRRYRA